ncbi:MAG TPA: hypothetical protein VKU79_00210 [Thermoplasmataceae archaeon]|nr:hypothetical protein [Thermoplasmatales archaeon AK]HLH85275.1 hypothetical protein [Thermoplasmataceae archaeon]
MTYRFGLIGNRISYSLSPRIHKQIMKICNISGSYEIVDTDALPSKDVLSRFDGLNITIPFKEFAVKSAESLDFTAMKTGAVNTLSIDDRIVGYNTDYLATRFLLETKSQCCGSAIVIGTGGAARAAVAALKDLGFYAIAIKGRDQKKTDSLRDFFKIKNNAEIISESHYDIAVNAVPPDGFSFLQEAISGLTFKFYLDYVYSLESPLSSRAKNKEISGISGIEILMLQAIFSEEIWTGIDLSRLYDLVVVRSAI